jgi:hypothetical protein
MFKIHLELEEMLGNRGTMATAYGYLGDIYRIRVDLDQAEEMYKKSLVLFQASGARHMVDIVKEMLTDLKKQKESGE